MRLSFICRVKLGERPPLLGGVSCWPEGAQAEDCWSQHGSECAPDVLKKELSRAPNRATFGPQPSTIRVSLPGLALETHTACSLTGAYSLCRPLLLAPKTPLLSASPRPSIMSSNETHDLYDLQSSLLPSTSYTLAYCLPLFLISLVLTCAGAFLIHDRTRYFKQRSHTLDDTERSSKLLTSSSSFLNGGLGGIFVGYAFGGAWCAVTVHFTIAYITFAVHFSTFLALAIPSTTSSAPLSPNVFLVIWIIGAVTCVPLGGRWLYAALVMAAMSGL